MTFTWPAILLALAALPVLFLLYLWSERRRVRSQEAFGNPDLLPNVVERKPGKLRFVPLLVLFVALGAMIVGIARPHATVSVPREEATVILAMDVSRSMKADDVEPTRLDAARVAAKAFLEEVPEKFRVGVVSFATRAAVGVAPTEDRELVNTALDTLAAGEGTAIGDAVALSIELGQKEKAEDGTTPPRTILLISDGKRDGGQVDPAEAAAAAQQAGIPVHTVLVGTPNGVVREQLQGGFTRIIQVPPDPETLEQLSSTTGGAALHGRRRRAAADGLRGAGLAAGRARGAARDHGRRRRRRRGAPALRRCALGLPLPEGPVRRVLVLAAGALVAALAVAAPAGSANECDGLQVCVPVAGPWVVVPPGRGVPRPKVEYTVTCPRRYVAGGLDAELSQRAIDLHFLGTLGSPVNPGISTSNKVVFVGSFVGQSPRAPTFKPYVGCLPSSGGGSRVPTSVSAFPPGQPTIRRVKTVRVRPGTATVAQGCRRGERLVDAAHAFGFNTAHASDREPRLPGLRDPVRPRRQGRRARAG